MALQYLYMLSFEFSELPVYRTVHHFSAIAFQFFHGDHQIVSAEFSYFIKISNE